MLTGSCKKALDYIVLNPTSTCDACKIKQINLSSTGGPVGEFDVSYDARGNATSIICVTPEPPFSYLWDPSSYYFRYDKNNRITDVLYVYRGNLGTVSWEQFTYKPHYIADTIWYYGAGGLITDKQPAKTNIGRASIITLDKFDRIAKEVTDIFQNIEGTEKITETKTYNYDKNGNLIYGAAAYDDKINFYRTSRNWQMIYRNFSANNILKGGPDYPEINITEYNQYGLPTKISCPGSAYLFGLASPNYEFVYDCDLSGIK